MGVSKRYIKDEVLSALDKKMVFIGGPRQVGKTTFSLSLLNHKKESQKEKHPAYLNWDHPLVPPKLRMMQLPIDEKLIILDEIHKYKHWRNLVKGIYDTEKSSRKILVTGSARLDFYRKGGDSLANRYRYFRLHPFSLIEMNKSPSEKDLNLLLKFGGFPEPLFSQDEKTLRLWQRDRMIRVVREDLRDLENVREISIIEQLAEVLPERVGSTLSIANLAQDLSVDHKSIQRWVSIFENLYYCFRIPPFGAPKIRAVKKEQKLFLWDWSVIENEGAKFENLIASQLLKYCHWLEDSEGFRMELRFLRDKEKREVDFVVLQNKKPLFAVECKSGEKAISPHVHYFAARTSIPNFYQVHRGEKEYSTGNITVMPFIKFCKRLNMP